MARGNLPLEPPRRQARILGADTVGEIRWARRDQHQYGEQWHRSYGEVSSESRIFSRLGESLMRPLEFDGRTPILGSLGQLRRSASGGALGQWHSPRSPDTGVIGKTWLRTTRAYATSKRQLRAALRSASAARCNVFHDDRSLRHAAVPQQADFRANR